MTINCANPIKFAKRMFWLAWLAAGGPQGMGWFQDRPSATEEDVWHNVQTHGDYAIKVGVPEDVAYGDYVFGRMLKMRLELSGNSITWGDYEPTQAYQSWCGKYLTYQALYDAAGESLEAEEEKNDDPG